MSEHQVAVAPGHFMWFVDHALDQMAVILRDLGDDLANQRPALGGANSPYAIFTHCLGVMEFWGGSCVAGRTVQRDRAAEFTATGTVVGLLETASTARRALACDIANLETMDTPDYAEDEPVPYAETKGSVLLHILEELYQHLGQMELTRDLLLAS